MTSNYIVMAVTLIIWAGIFVFLLRLDRRTKKLEENR
ncbi:MAG: CcmD family protein [FCB group bacterium]|nr:CcmD family protein [FCB group bacterium]